MNLSDLIGIPYKQHGRDESGLDCFGLIWLIAFRLDKPILDIRNKSFDPSLMKLADQMNVKKIDALEPGCVIEMVKDGRLHLGYAIDKDRMIHSTTNEGVIVEPVGTYSIMGFWAFD